MFTIETVRALKWCNPEHTVFECIVKYAEFNTEEPVGVNQQDSYAHIRELWNNGTSGVYGDILEYVDPGPDPYSPEALARKAARMAAAANNQTTSG
jgi:hypothetical protein